MSLSPGSPPWCPPAAPSPPPAPSGGAPSQSGRWRPPCRRPRFRRPVPSSPVPMVPPAKETPGSAGGMERPGGGSTASCPPARGDWLSLRDRRGHRARELSIKSGQGWPWSWGGSPVCVFSPRARRGGARGGESPRGAAWGEGCGAPPNPSLRARHPGGHRGN